MKKQKHAPIDVKLADTFGDQFVRAFWNGIAAMLLIVLIFVHPIVAIVWWIAWIWIAYACGKARRAKYARNWQTMCEAQAAAYNRNEEKQ